MPDKICERCGNTFFSYSLETRNLCYCCQCKAYNADLGAKLLSGEETSTDCETEVFCPWCGMVIEGDCEDVEFYEDGTYTYICPDCEKEFTLETSVSYHYSTSRELPGYILRERADKKERARRAELERAKEDE